MDIQMYEDKQNQPLSPDVQEEIEKIRTDLSAEHERYLRTLANFKNYRCSIEHNGKKIVEEGIRKMLLPMLDIIDDMEKALQSTNCAEQPFALGVRIIHQKFLDLLETNRVFPFKSLGTPFNNHPHETVDTAKVEGGDPGTVIDEVRRGYLWKDGLLRPAQVRISGEYTKINNVRKAVG